MRTPEEWMHSIYNRSGTCSTAEQVFWRNLFYDIQNDAFHAGKLEGLQEAKEIISNKFQDEIHGLTSDKK